MRIEGINTYNNTKLSFKSNKTKIIKDVAKPVTELLGASIIAAGVMHSLLNTAPKKEEPIINSDYLDDKVKNVPRFDGDLILKTFDYPVMTTNPKLTEHLNKLLNIKLPEPILFVNYLFGNTEFTPQNIDEYEAKTTHKQNMVNILADENNKEIVKTIFTNFAKVDAEFEKIGPRFNSEEICDLIKLYHQTEEKELVKDLIKDCLIVDWIDSITPYRFNAEEIQGLVKTYEETPYKEYMLKLLSQRTYVPDMGTDGPIHESGNIVKLINNCKNLEEAELFTKALDEMTVVDEENEDDTMPFYLQGDFYHLKELYDHFPEDVTRLMTYREKGLTGKDEPRFTVENIESFIAAKDMFGDAIYNIIESTDSNDMLEAVMDNLCARYDKAQEKIDTSRIPQPKKKKYLN